MVNSRTAVEVSGQVDRPTYYITPVGEWVNYERGVSAGGIAPIDKGEVARFLTESQLGRLSTDRLRAYGLGNLTTDRNQRMVEKMMEGDHLVFYFDKMLRSMGRVVQVVESEDLSLWLFGDRRYKFVVFLDDFRELGLPASTMAESLYGKGDGVVRGLRRLNELNGTKLEGLLG